MRFGPEPILDFRAASPQFVLHARAHVSQVLPIVWGVREAQFQTYDDSADKAHRGAVPLPIVPLALGVGHLFHTFAMDTTPVCYE